MSASVELAGVTHRYRSRLVLEDINLEVHPGITGLIGPNGVGKTTLLRLLATVLQPTEGEILVQGSPTSREAERTRIRRRLGYLPQELGFPTGFTAFGFVEYMAVLKEWVDAPARRAEVRRVLELVGLSEAATRSVRRLSGGMRRRLGLAQALLGEPSLLLLDEPTSGLDPEQRAALRNLLTDLGTSATVVMATHQTEDVAALCENVVVLADGHVGFAGRIADFVRHAHGRVWLADYPDPAALQSQRVASGRFRNVGTPPAGAEQLDPAVEDAYLVFRNLTARDQS